MLTVTLDWSLLPALMYLPLDRFKGKDGFYYPYFGPGVYLFVYPSKAGYQVYYVGQSKEVGNRLGDHISAYMNSSSGYYLPRSVDLYNEDVYKYFKKNSYEEYFSNIPGDFIDKNYTETGEHIMKNSYFGIAKLSQADESLLLEVEYILQQNVLEFNELPSLGWLGEKKSTKPTRDIEIINYFGNDILRKIIGTTLPGKCSIR